MTLLNKLKNILYPDGRMENSKDSSEQYDVDSSKDAPDYEKQMNFMKNDRLRQIALLTPREHELYLLLMEGYTLKECAEQMSIKYSTANTHMTGIYKKLGVNSRAKLIINYHTADE